MPHAIETTPDALRATYAKMEKNLGIAKKRLANRPLTLAEKILLSHLADPQGQDLDAGKSYLLLHPDRIAMQDATAQMALLQFAHAGRKQVAVPTTVHCDHLIRAKSGAKEDTDAAIQENKEVYGFLESASRKYGIGFWRPGAGIIHQVVLENYAFPGGLMIGTDSHTPNAGGLGMIAAGVGGADAVDVMAGFPWEVLYPKPLGVRLTGEMNGWTAPKDIILYLCGVLTVKGGTNRVIEYFGPGARTISCTGKATICNMGAELGATGSVFPFDDKMDAYLRTTGRAAIADIAQKNRSLLQADADVEESWKKYFDQVVEIDLSKLEPHVVGPHTPDLARPVSKLAKEAKEKGYPDDILVALIGSCTNSSYEDICRAADVAEQARSKGGKAAIPLLVTPGSDQIEMTIRRDGQLATLEAIGGKVLANACGPCIGQWKREDIRKGEKNTIFTSFNRNFPARNDENKETMAFIGSPEITIAYGLAGRLSFNPLTDELAGSGGKKYKLSPPKKAPELPSKGFVKAEGGFVSPPDDGSKVEIKVDPRSERLQLLEPFAAWDGKDYEKLPVLVKAKGKCTTDHISPAGPWLRFRGHLDRISDNCFLGAVNAFTGEAGAGKNQLTGAKGEAYPKIARSYKAAKLRWVVVGDDNYGEGSSREHAAMEPRFLGGVAIIAKSFARIHESNLKKQGLLPLHFKTPSDYDKVQEDDRISLVGLSGLAPGKDVKAIIHHADGKTEEIALKHTFNSEQVGWFKAGSALNLLRAGAKA
ncbi:aconitate hydratase [bacterium]|nr:aconitate hydratase [bacterium]